jgi:uncharacterized oligopeptide transporter (OPT) family protein
MSAPSSDPNATPETGTPEGLPNLLEVPEDQRDAMWLKHYYAGDKPQLTLRAVLMGGLLGMVMSVSNLYTTLKLGWAFGVAITASVLSYMIWGGMRRVGLAKDEMTILENNCMQSTASAAGYSTGGTLATAVGALLLISGDEGRLGWMSVGAWVLFTALLGVFLAIPMKRQMINSEQLAFPSGIAAAETLRSLYAKGDEAKQKARALAAALGAGAVVAFIRDAMEWIPASIEFPFTIATARGRSFTGHDMAMGFEVGLLLIAAGMIVGIRVSSWMFIGSLTNYTVLAPYALSQDDWEEEGRTFFGHIDTAAYGLTFDVGSSTLPEASAAGAYQMLSGDEGTGRYRLVPYARETEPNPTELGVARGNAVREALIARGMSPDAIEVAEPEIIGVRDGSRRVLFLRLDPGNPDFHERPITLMIRLMRWSLWLGTALLVASGLTSFALGWRTIVRAFSGLGKKKEGAAVDPVAHLEVPSSWLVAGMIPVSLGLMAVCWLSFGIAPWLGFLSVVLAFILALVASRATGETDTTPIGAMGKITQFTYALLAPANTTVNLMTAGITAGAAGSAADLLTDLKSGYLLGANARQQFIAQFIGLFFGVVAVVPLWYLLVPNQAALEAFNSPATGMWYAVAQALANGVEVIPETARMAIVAGGLLGIVLTLIEALVPKKIRPYTPSAMGLGLAFIVPFANAFSFFIGAVIAEIWTRVAKKTAERYIVPLASGAVAGESIVAAGIAIKGAASGIIAGD